jgi:hypothetical protein
MRITEQLLGIRTDTLARWLCFGRRGTLRKRRRYMKKKKCVHRKKLISKIERYEV